MSTDQPGLSEFESDDTPALHEETLDGEGAQYTPSEDPRLSAPQQGPENECRNCGSEVSSQVARVLGDNDGCIPACAEPECREDVIVDASLAVDSYQETARIVREVRARENGNTTDPSAGGRR